MQKAEQTLESTIQRIDNILLSAEQASGNMIHYLFLHIDEPDKMYDFSRKLVENNRFIKGCAIAMEPSCSWHITIPQLIRSSDCQRKTSYSQSRLATSPTTNRFGTPNPLR